MDNNKIRLDHASKSREIALHYFETLVEVARESFLILDPKLRVITANPVFFKKFQVSKKETESRFLYDLGNGQWNIPELRKLLEEILPKKKVVKDYDVSHVFETIGEKTIELNARQIDTVQLIILAMEDITVRKNLEEKLAENIRTLEDRVRQRTAELDSRISELESLNKSMVGRELKMVELKKEIEALKRKSKNGNSNGKNGKKNGNGNGNGNHKNN